MKQTVTNIIVAIIAIIPTIICGWFVYDQNTKDKMTDFKIEQMRKENEIKTVNNSRHIAMIYGELWTLLVNLEADRCFILQPHPEKKHLYISASFEVNKKGISKVSDVVQNIPISEIPLFAKEIATNMWLYYDNIDSQVPCLLIKSLMKISGSTNIAIKQMVNISGDWVGSLVVENTAQKPLDDHAREYMRYAVQTIQFILPPKN